MGATHDGMTVRQLVARMDALAWEGARLRREYVRLGVTLHARLQGEDHVLATRLARPAGAAGGGPRLRRMAGAPGAGRATPGRPVGGVMAAREPTADRCAGRNVGPRWLGGHAVPSARPPLGLARRYTLVGLAGRAECR